MTDQTTPSSSSGLREFFVRLGIIGELLAFLWKRKLYWLLPLVITLVVVGIVIIIGGSSPLIAPFIYPIIG